ncbi:MAG TPA: sensor histidine kinase, partial [Lapillicoccus sp.]|nr:sensor histidine kinase [Lapillicoccus sp.]
RAPRDTELTDGSTVVIVRSIPLRAPGPLEHVGALVLLRDVTDLRSRDRELVTKDATIREIHHRVKNNLQSVAALLRLQARRTDDEQARAALSEAERRVGTIALVHETLSKGFEETVDFDEVADQGFRAVAEVAAYDQRIERQRTGDSFGRLRAEDATSLAMILSELVQNAIEHGFPDGHVGTVTVDVKRVAGVPGAPDVLTVKITDDGVGFEDRRRPGSGLGTQIVQSLVQDLRGTIRWTPAGPHGTQVTFTAALRPLKG